MVIQTKVKLETIHIDGIRLEEALYRLIRKIENRSLPYKDLRKAIKALLAVEALSYR